MMKENNQATKKIMLARRIVGETLFDELLVKFKERIVVVDDMTPYIFGYPEKKKMIYNGRDQMICREYLLGGKNADTDWKQVIITKNITLQGYEVRHELRGFDAFNRMKKLLLKYYDEEELEEIFTSVHHEQCAPMHYNPLKMTDKIVKHENCYKYDINSAYASAYITLFPRAKDAIMALYLARHEKPENKQVLNYFNGMMKRKGYEGFYYWVVNRTNEIMTEALKKTGGTKLYINTDGFIVKNPSSLIEHSTELGKFKEEYKGDVYIYHDRNYFVIQCGYKNEKPNLTGTCFASIRENMDLEKGIVVHYDRKRIEIDEEHCIYAPENITTEKVEIE